ncbi:MAG: methylenetetrahydrofolate reductase [Bacillota bacterium]
MAKQSNLQKVLQQGYFAVTAEVGPPRCADFAPLKEKAEMLRDYVDAINITDNQTAIVRLSSQSCCGELVRMGIDPVFQMTCRDRNRIALQSDILGAAAQGAINMLCLSGDHQTFGSEPNSKNVFDMDSIQLIDVLAGMTRGVFAGGDRMEAPLAAFIGAAVNPFADPLELRVSRLRKKVKVGAQFVQTQCVYDLDRFARFMEMVRKEGLDGKVHILAGITPLKSAKAARYMRDKVAGITVPEDLIKRMEAAADPKEEGIRICLETIRQLQEIKGVAGIHLMAIAWEEAVPEIVRQAGLYPRPVAEG